MRSTSAAVRRRLRPTHPSATDLLVGKGCFITGSCPECPPAGTEDDEQRQSGDDAGDEEPEREVRSGRDTRHGVDSGGEEPPPTRRRRGSACRERQRQGLASPRTCNGKDQIGSPPSSTTATAIRSPSLTPARCPATGSPRSPHGLEALEPSRIHSIVNDLFMPLVQWQSGQREPDTGGARGPTAAAAARADSGGGDRPQVVGHRVA